MEPSICHLLVIIWEVWNYNHLIAIGWLTLGRCSKYKDRFSTCSLQISILLHAVIPILTMIQASWSIWKMSLGRVTHYKTKCDHKPLACTKGSSQVKTGEAGMEYLSNTDSTLESIIGRQADTSPTDLPLWLWIYLAVCNFWGPKKKLFQHVNLFFKKRLF